MTDRNKHYRDRDHSGSLAASVIVLSDDIGPYVAGTNVMDVLAGLYTSLASSYPIGSFTANAVQKRVQIGSFVADAVVV